MVHLVILVLGFEITVTLISICFEVNNKMEVFQQNHVQEMTAGYRALAKIHHARHFNG